MGLLSNCPLFLSPESTKLIIFLIISELCPRFTYVVCLYSIHVTLLVLQPSTEQLFPDPPVTTAICQSLSFCCFAPPASRILFVGDKNDLNFKPLAGMVLWMVVVKFFPRCRQAISSVGSRLKTGKWHEEQRDSLQAGAVNYKNVAPVKRRWIRPLLKSRTERKGKQTLG